MPDFETRRVCVVFENREFLAVHKPPGLLVHPSKPGCGWTLWDGLREVLAFELAGGGQVGLVNRLDRETSGLVLVAKSSRVAGRLGAAMQRMDIGKVYLAWVHGWPFKDEWVHNGPVRRRPSAPPLSVWLKREVHPDGAPALTSFRVLRRVCVPVFGVSRQVSLIEATPKTGRTHQIRVHLASSGYPVIGDKIYGRSEGDYLEFVETGWSPGLAGRLWVEHHALHAWRLQVPYEGKILEICAGGGARRAGDCLLPMDPFARPGPVAGSGAFAHPPVGMDSARWME